MKILPETRSGKWSVGFSAAAALLILLAVLILAFGAKGDGWTWDPLTITVVCIFGIVLLSTMLGLVVGLISIIKSKERAVLVFVAVVVSLYIAFLLIGELLSAVGVLPSH